jgi:hypothetical protein
MARLRNCVANKFVLPRTIRPVKSRYGAKSLPPVLLKIADRVPEDPAIGNSVFA